MKLRNKGSNTQFECTIKSGQGIADSSSDDDTTLKQLRKRLLTKKRKCIAKQEDKKSVEGESDLHEPLINLKQKHSKITKYKRKRVKLSVFYSSDVDFAVKSEENLVSIGCPKVICDEVKIPEEGLNPDETSTNGLKSMVLCDYREPIICTQQNNFCSDDPSKISYDHVLYSEPISILAPSDGMGADLELPKMESEEILDLAPLSIQMANGITDSHNSSSFTVENISSPDNQISDMEFDSIDGGCGLPKEINPVLSKDRTEADSQLEVEDCPSSLDKNCGSYPNSNIFLKVEENVVSTEDNANKMEFSSVPLEDKTEANLPNRVDDSPSSPDKNRDSYTDSVISSKIEENVVSTEDVANEMEFSSVQLEDKTEANFPNEVDDSPSSTDKNQDSYPDSVISSKIEENVVSTEDVANEMEFSSVQLEDKTESNFPNEVDDSPSSPDKNRDTYTDSVISSKIGLNVVSTEDITSKMEFCFVPLGDKTEADFPNEVDDSPSSPDKNLDSYTDSVISSKIELNVVSTEDTIYDEDQSSTCSNVTGRDGLNWEGRIEGELPKAGEKQTKALPITDEENRPSLENHTHDVADTIPTSGLHLSPENLLSTRKAISPYSQEQLCVAMNSVETWNGVDQNKCKENHSERQTTTKASSLRSEIQLDKANINNRRPDKFRQRKIIITPPHNSNIKKPQIPKINLEGPRFSRALPNLSTDCTSIQSCSERAIEFSKQQMRDMESLALKLTNELKSMKDIVEQKLLFEAYRNVSLKNDADEIKSAINSAVKVEETSRKWLSIMSRDCNRFCKIMKLTPNTPTASNDPTPSREKRKIVFADEAGGDLCHVKIFEDDDVITSSPASDGAVNTGKM